MFDLTLKGDGYIASKDLYTPPDFGCTLYQPQEPPHAE